MLPANSSDRESFEALFEEHHGAVLAYCIRRTRSDADAEDLTAETFAVAWRRRTDIPADPRPWLYAVARRVIANHHRGTGRWTRLLDRLRFQQHVDAPQSAAHGGPALVALAELSANDQELLKLVAWEGLAHGEIAESLGITANAVAIRLHRARQRYEVGYRALGGRPPKESTPIRTSLPATGSSTRNWRHDDT